MLRIRPNRIPALVLALALAAVARPGLADPVAPAVPAGRVLLETVHGVALEGTVTGENPDRAVAVYLPPGYDATDRRYPVLYLLHGIGATQKDWTDAWDDPDDPWGTVPRVLDRGIAEGRLAEMIVVMPDEKTTSGGSWYVDSSVTGGWETFTAKELVAWTDARFRTLATAGGRGIAGHSMGGIGAITLGMKHPDVYSVVYGMSSAALGWGGDFAPDNPAFREALELRSWQDVDGFWDAGLVCAAQAFSPNPERPPFFVDWPFRVGEDGSLVPNEPAWSSWVAHQPVAQAARYRENLLKLRGLRLDAGDRDQFTHIPVTSRELSRVLEELEVPHVFEEYNGDHRNRLWGRTGRFSTEILPWFSMLLDSSSAH